MRRILWIIAGAFMLTTAHAASFDCMKASTKIEKMICNNQELSELDSEMDKAYKDAFLVKGEEVTSDQRKWLKHTRSECNDDGCLKRAYLSRIEKLNAPFTPRTEQVPAEQSEDFQNFDSKSEEVQALVAYIRASEWPNALDQISEYRKFGENQFLYQIKSAPIASGLFYVDTGKKIEHHIIFGFIEWMRELDADVPDRKYYLVFTGSGTHGSGYSDYQILEVSNMGDVAVRGLYSHSFDMESGLCGRPEIGIKKAADVKGYVFNRNPKPGRVIFSVIEQNCPNGKKKALQRSFPINGKSDVTIQSGVLHVSGR